MSALSVVTEENILKGTPPYLKGNTEYLSSSSSKDFVINDTQIYQSAYFGVGALLIIAKILSLSKTENLLTSELLNIIPLVEIHDQQDLEKAIEAGVNFIGINNRKLLL